MLTSRQLDTKSEATSKRATRTARTSKRPSPGSSRQSTGRKLKAANKQAAKSDKARAKAQAERKAAEKALVKAKRQVKKKEQAAKQQKRQLKRERREQRRVGTTGSRRLRRTRRRSERSSSRRGFERRSSGRTRVLLIAALAAISLVAIGGVVYVNSSAFGVTSIEVTGTSKTSVDEIIAASGIEIDQNLLEVEHEAVAEEIEQVPWVATASIDRRWNGSITIEITERQAVAALESPTGFVLVDAFGRQLEKVASPPESQIPVSGVEVSGVVGEDVSAAGLQATNFIGSISPKVRPMVTSINLDSGRLVAQLDVTQIGQKFAAAGSSIEANFGTNQELDAKMASLETVLVRVDLTCVVRVDLSSPSKPTVMRTPAVTKLEKLPTGLVDC